MYEFQAFVSILFEKCEMRVSPGQKLPAVDLAKEGVGVSQPAQPFLVQMRKKR